MARAGKQEKTIKTNEPESRSELVYYNVNCAPFTVYGLQRDEKNGYVRMPLEIAKQISKDFEGLNNSTAGGRVRFSTDSTVVSVKCKLNGSWRMTHMADVGTTGFDLYEARDGKQTFLGSVLPPRERVDEYSGKINLKHGGVRDLILDMPLFSGVSELLIGIESGSILRDGGKYKYKTPVVFYGSSITHGACASRPGNCYIGMLSRRFDTDYLNFGYSGNAHGEPIIFDYLSKLNMSIFVYDYDHNAQSVEMLRETHYNGYKIIRTKQPQLPIIMVTRPDYDNPACDGKPYRDVICDTYEKALAEGDTNVYFIDGEKEFKTFVADGYTVDCTHPNDLGFELMAQKIGDVIAKILEK